MVSKFDGVCHTLSPSYPTILGIARVAKSVDARDFPPPADLPEAEKSSIGRMKELEHKPAAYALCNDDQNWIYKGSTRDLADRIAAHLAGKVPRTKSRLPLKLVYCEYFDNYTDARLREIWLKTGQGREWLKKTDQ